MNSVMTVDQRFFGLPFLAPQGRYAPCSMFSDHHFIASSVSLLTVSLLLLITKKKTIGTKTKRCFAVILTLLEGLKISHSFVYGDFYLDAWFPLSYCGLFIFAIWMSAFSKGKTKRMGDIFIAYGCPIAGLSFLIFPTTSIMLYPIWHYFSLYSMFFHTAMLFFGISYLRQESKLTRKGMLTYTVFLTPFVIISCILNTIFGSNLMNLTEPYNIPIGFLQAIAEISPYLYTLFVFFMFLLIPPVTELIRKTIKNIKQKR